MVLLNRLSALCILLVAVSCIAPAHAAPLNLSLGGPGAVPWTVVNLEPGDTATSTVELHNAGTIDGYVAIWVTNISETDFRGDGALLGTYIYFKPVTGRIGGNTPLPATIYQLPADPLSPPYLYLSPLHAGETVSLDWQWVFVDTGVPQNNAQGDTLSFDLNYMLTELPPPVIEEVTESRSAARTQTHTMTLPGSGDSESATTVAPTPAGGNITHPTPEPTPPWEGPLPAGSPPVPWLVALLGLLLLSFTLWRATVEEQMPGWLKATGMTGVLLSVAGTILIPYYAPVPACEALRIPCSALMAATIALVALIPLSGHIIRHSGTGKAPGRLLLHRKAGSGAIVMMAAAVIFGIMMYGTP